MPQTIHAPNGDILQFPESMTDEQIATVMRREYPGAGGGVGTQGGTGARGPVEDTVRGTIGGAQQGILAIGNMQNDAMNAGVHAGTAAVRAAGRLTHNRQAIRAVDSAGRVVDRTVDENAPSSGQIASGPVGHAAGADYEPGTTSGQIGHTGGQFASGALLPGGVASRVMAVVVPTATTEIGRTVDKGLGGNGEAGAFVGGLVGGAMTPGGAENAASRVSRFPRLAERVAASDRAGVDPMLATEAGPAGHVATNVVGSNLPAGTRVRARVAAGAGQVEASARRVAAGYGEARGPQITGENVQAGVERFAGSEGTPPTPTAPARASSFGARAEQLYTDAFAPITATETRAVQRQAGVSASRRAAGRPDPPQNPIIQPTQTQAVLGDLSSRANAPRLSAMITDPRFGQLAEALTRDAPDVRFGDLRNLRTWVRNAQRDPTLRGGVSQADLQRLEGALTQDIYSNAQRLGGAQALSRLQRADQYYAAGSARIQTALQPFASANSGESAFARIVRAAGSTSSADAQQLLSLKRSLSPAEWGDVAANVVTELGREAPGQASGAERGFSLNTFVTNYNRLAPRARQVLFGSIGGGGANATNLASDLDNLVAVAGRMKDVGRGANTSNTFSHAQTVATGAGLLTPHTAIPTAATIGALHLTGEMLTNPRVVRWLAGLEVAQRSPGNWTAHLRRLSALVRADPQLQPLLQQMTDQEQTPGPDAVRRPAAARTR